MTALPIIWCSICESLAPRCDVVRNDEPAPLRRLLGGVDGLVVSPGPCAPGQAGISIDDAARGRRDPACQASGAGRLPGSSGACRGVWRLGDPGAAPMHGKTSLVWHDDSPPFGGVPNPTEVMRYHSLVVDPASLPGSAARDGAHQRRRDHGPGPPQPIPSTASSSIRNRSSHRLGRRCLRSFLGVVVAGGRLPWRARSQEAVTMIRQAIDRVVTGHDLTEAESACHHDWKSCPRR